MELTTKGRYAVMAMADLAGHADDGAIALSVVAERQSLPLAYLEQLFVPLRRAGLRRERSWPVWRIPAGQARGSGFRGGDHGGGRGGNALHPLLA